MANQEHLEILKQGEDAWNAWREENPEIEPDLSGLNFSELEVFQNKFPIVRLKKWVSFPIFKAYDDPRDLIIGSQLNSSATDLSDAQFQSVLLNKCNFSGSVLHRTDFTQAFLRRCDMTDASTKKAKLHYSIFLSSKVPSLVTASLHETAFQGVTIIGKSIPFAEDASLSFYGSDLEGANFSCNIIKSLSFYNCNLSHARIQNTTINRITMNNCVSTKLLFTSNTVGTCDIFNTNCNQMNLRDTTIEYGVLKGADLQDADLKDAKFSKMIFANTDLQKAKLDNTDFGHSTFRNIWLSSRVQIAELGKPLALDQVKETIFIDQVATIAEKPYAELSERALRSRRNLLLLAMLCILWGASVQVTEIKTLSGAQVTGLTGPIIFWLIISVSLYFLGQFILQARACFLGWELAQEQLAIPDGAHSDICYSRSVLEDFSKKFRTYKTKTRRRFWLFDVGFPVLLSIIGFAAMYFLPRIQWFMDMNFAEAVIRSCQ